MTFRVPSFGFRVVNSRLATRNSKHATGDMPVFRGQSTIEYAVGITVALAALLGMQAYTKRGLQARLKTVVDGATTAIGAPTQYEPYYAGAASVVTEDSRETFTYAPGGTITTTQHSDSSTDPGAQQSVGVDLKADDGWK